MRVPRKLKKKIPKGHYCYTFNGKNGKVWSNDFNGFVEAYGIDCCPMFFKNELGYGDCKLTVMQYGLNGDEGLDLALNDQCKCCGIKMN